MVTGITRPIDPAIQVSGPAHGFAPDCTGSEVAARPSLKALTLLDVAHDVRRKFGLEAELSDADLMASLAAAFDVSAPRARWMAIFRSPLGAALSTSCADLNTALGSILAALPQPRS